MLNRKEVSKIIIHNLAIWTFLLLIVLVLDFILSLIIYGKSQIYLGMRGWLDFNYIFSQMKFTFLLSLMYSLIMYFKRDKGDKG
jgi:uncharacterized membrane protein YhdT